MDAKLTLDQLSEVVRPHSPAVAVVVGSGMMLPFTSVLEIPYHTIQGMPVTKTAGHKSVLQVVSFESGTALIFCGRPHWYEGWNLQDLCFTNTIAASLKITCMLFTNAVGSLREHLPVGSIVQASGIIRPVGTARIMGTSLEHRKVTQDSDWEARTLYQCLQAGLMLHRGVYVQTWGPQYETRAEIAMFRRLGADIIGMSTGIEAIAARSQGMKAQVLSLVTNQLSAVNTPRLTHDHVLNVAAASGTAIVTAIQSAIFAAWT